MSTFRDTGGRDRLLTPALSSVEEEREKRSGKDLRFDLGLWTGFRYTGATGVTFRSGGREIRANIPHPLYPSETVVQTAPESKVQSPKSKMTISPRWGFVRILAVPNAVPRARLKANVSGGVKMG